MIRLPARLPLTALAALAFAVSGAAPLAAQDTGQNNPGSFNLPPPSPTPTPAPAGPADERAGVEIPPQAVPRATPSAVPTAAPTTTPRALPSATLPAPVRTASAQAPTQPPAQAPAPQAGATPAPTATLAPAPLPTASSDPLALPTLTAPEAGNTATIVTIPAWQLVAAGGFGALLLLGAGLFVWQRRKPKALRLAAPSAAAARQPEAAPDLADLHLALDVTTATRSVMMFTLGYRLNIANRAGRAANDVRVAVQIACARASGANAPSAGAAQTLGEVERIGPHQGRSITGEVRLPLAAITPLRQGSTALFVPLVHVTIAADGQPAMTKTFVIGTPSASGRVHPILLDQPPGGIPGLVAQAVAIPAASAAA